LTLLLISTRKIREQIRSKVSIYNCGIVSKELGFYGAEDNKEWQQYQLEEEGITRPARCPFKKLISQPLKTQNSQP
jgi:FPC/CPF motif-containing protein YcgG